MRCRIAPMDEKKRLGTPLNGNVHALKIRNMMINAIVYVRIGWVGQCEGLSVAGRDKGCMADQISQTNESVWLTGKLSVPERNDKCRV